MSVPLEQEIRQFGTRMIRRMVGAAIVSFAGIAIQIYWILRYIEALVGA